MILNTTLELYKNIDTIFIIKNKDVFYPLQHVLQKKNIVFDENSALAIKLLPEDMRYPANSKITDSGQITAYKLSLSITDQDKHTEEQLFDCINQKVIVVFKYLNAGRCVVGCNENPLFFLFEDDNASNPIQNHGFNVELTGNTYFTKVNL
jgi:hypothetical protein